MSLSADFFRRLPKNFSSRMDQCWVDWESVIMQCTHCAKLYPLDPRHPGQTRDPPDGVPQRRGRLYRQRAGIQPAGQVGGHPH